LLLVSASVLVIGGIDLPSDRTPTVRGTTHVGGSMTVSYHGQNGDASVTGTMGGLLCDAAVVATDPDTPGDRAFVDAVRTGVDRHVERHGIPVQFVATCNRNATGAKRVAIVAGREPPSDVTVTTTVYHGSPSEVVTPCTEANSCEPIVVVRRWSP
jgi:hypothetical protein